MTAKHADPEYRKNARIIRQGVAKKRRAGVDVTCWRCGGDIDPEQTYDVGHIDPAAGHGIGNLAPEHRYKQGARCQGNRAAGGRQGKAIQTAKQTASKGLLPW
jgi:hypothetical protein